MSCDFEVGAYARMSLSYPPWSIPSTVLRNHHGSGSAFEVMDEEDELAVRRSRRADGVSLIKTHCVLLVLRYSPR